jgi:cytochrome c553
VLLQIGTESLRDLYVTDALAGVKFTAMPAWPSARRDDEVWAMVAFLRRLPGLDAAAYQRLVRGDEVAGDDVAALPGRREPRPVPGAVAARCAPCHGVDGHGRGLGAFPKLAGQRPAYLVASLQAFAHGARHSGTMESVAAGLDGNDLEELARYYAALPEASPPSWRRADSAAALELGEAIAQHGIPAQRVPACAACHGPGTSLRHPMYPRLAGQYPEYLALQLGLFKADVRGGTAFAHIMRMVAGRLTSEQMRAVALYYASVPPALDRPGP